MLILVRTNIFGNIVKVEQAFVTLDLAEFWHSLTITWFTIHLVILEIINLWRTANNMTQLAHCMARHIFIHRVALVKQGDNALGSVHLFVHLSVNELVLKPFFLLWHADNYLFM